MDASVEPVAYRDEQGMLVQDLSRFLTFVMHNEVPAHGGRSHLSPASAEIVQILHRPGKPVEKKGWRFGFGRRYHLYPDRFSLIYDYAYYQGYITEEETGWIRLTERGAGKILNKEMEPGQEIYRFWLRLYRKPVPHLPGRGPLDRSSRAGKMDSGRSDSKGRLRMDEPYYYETEGSLLRADSEDDDASRGHPDGRGSGRGRSWCTSPKRGTDDYRHIRLYRKGIG